MEPVRIILVGLSESFTRSVTRFAKEERRITLVGAAPRLTLADFPIPSLRPELALFSWSALSSASPDAIRKLRADLPGLRVCCLASKDDAYRTSALAAGADGMLSSENFGTEIIPFLQNFFPTRMGVIGDSRE